MVQPLTSEAKAFLTAHLQDDPAKLALQASRYPGLPVQELVKQIAARQKAVQKLPTWVNNPDIIFPVSVSVEQASSELTAAYKAGLVSGKLLIDLTGGFGVDSTFFANSFEKVIYLERNPELVEIVKHNLQVLGVNNVICLNEDAETFINSFTETADCIYLDPARRGTSNEKLHILEDCEPDILRLLPVLLKKGKKVLLKSSPMLDIELAVQQLGSVAEIHVVAVDNDCKEVLYLISETAVDPPEIKAVNLHKTKPAETFAFSRAIEEAAEVQYSEPMAYIYEPNAAILKAGAFKSVAAALGVFKLNPNSHLYTSETLVEDFPGRSFFCEAVSKYHKKELLKFLPDKKANIAVRNFPDTVAGIRKKTGIKEGGTIYLFATSDIHQKPVILICRKAF